MGRDRTIGSLVYFDPSKNSSVRRGGRRNASCDVHRGKLREFLGRTKMAGRVATDFTKGHGSASFSWSMPLRVHHVLCVTRSSRYTHP